MPELIFFFSAKIQCTEDPEIIEVHIVCSEKYHTCEGFLVDMLKSQLHFFGTCFEVNSVSSSCIFVSPSPSHRILDSKLPEVRGLI